MPELVRWGSVILQVFFNDTGKHHLPHFHVRTFMSARPRGAWWFRSPISR